MYYINTRNELNQPVQNGLIIFIPTPRQTPQQDKRGPSKMSYNSTLACLLILSRSTTKTETSGRPLYFQDIDEPQMRLYDYYTQPYIHQFNLPSLPTKQSELRSSSWDGIPKTTPNPPENDNGALYSVFIRVNLPLD